MQRLALAVLVALPALVDAAPAPPWLRGVDVWVDATSDDARTSRLLPEDPGCAPSASLAVETTANVSSSAGRETIVASYAQGITVRGAEGDLLASAPGYPCVGSADAMEQIVVGRAWGEDVLGFVITTGGHREAVTWFVLYHLSRRDGLEAMFSGAIEAYRDGETRGGEIALVPGALLHREPTGQRVLWVLDSSGHFYLPYSLSPGESH